MTGNKKALLPLFLSAWLPLLLLNTCRRCEAIRIPPNLKQPPIITEQAPENYIVFPTDDIVLKCEATGVPAPEFRWTKDGVVFDPSREPRATMNQTSGTIVIGTTGNGVSIRGYRGTYRCYASNDYGTAISSNIHLITESTPKWPKESVRQYEKEAGESLVLQCNPPTSMASSMIIWMTSKLFNIKLSERVSQGQNGNLYFSNLLVEDSLEDYTCYAQIPGTRTIIQKEPIALRVNTSNSVKYRKPRLLHPVGQSSSRLALRGKPLYLECIAEGLPTPTVHWERLDGSLPRERVSYENFNKTLKISDVIEDDDGEYRCAVKNGQGQVKHTYSVSVEAAPYWVRVPEDGIYGPGENVRLVCDIDAKPKAEIRWRVNGVLLSDTDPSPSRREMGSTVILTGVQKEDTAVYQCEARNKHGTLLANIIVQVIELPAQILTPPDKEYAIVEKQIVYIHCKAFGAPTPKILWSKEDMEAVLQDRRYFLNTSGTLRIEDARKADGGVFTCNATNAIGADSITATLIVKNASQIIEPPTDQHIKRLHSVIFGCEVEVDQSLHPPELWWKKDGVTVDEADDDESKYHIRQGSLKIKSVGYEDEGIYTCVARTSLDTVMASAQLIVVVNGTASGPLRELNISSAGTTRYRVRHLQPQSVYKFHLMGQTSAGRGRAASKEIFTSREGEPRVLKNISYVMGDTHTNITWIGLEGHRVAELHVQYMAKDGMGDWKDLKAVNSSQNFFMLDGLQPGTPYRIKLWQLGRFKNVTIWDKEVQTIGPAFTELNNGIATQGWFIGLISAIVLLILILLIVCFIKRNKGGKYSVKDKEDAHVDSEARPMKDETFGEYSDNDQEEKPFEGSQPSLDVQIKPLGSDDSLVEYGGSVDVQFNEDGSFIGQYSGKKEGKEDGGANGSSGATSPVNVDITLD
ncbi:neural cell adhesion molecule L1-like [Heterodontus francisci]|uniref:neural cell adhesion molecule L1-like n=1 Tax=Heterodontus francisci TaxID=7792 RepID=UPI00355C2150